MSTDDVVRTVTIKTLSDGAPQATKDLRDLAAAQQGVAVASDTTSKSTLSAAASLNKLQNQLDPSYRSATQLNSAQTTLGKSFDQGLVSVDRYNQLMQLASQRFDDAGKKASPFATALTGVKTQIIALSAGLGPVGTALAAFGPIGLAAGAGIALVGAAFDEMSSRADELAGKAQNLSTFATITGLTTDQLQALNETAAKFGVTSETTQRFIDSFTSKLTELRTASGPLYDAIVKVDAGIAQQMLTAKGTAAELDLYVQAWKEAAAAGNGNALLTAAGGRGGVSAGPVVGAIADAGGLDALNAAMDQGSRLAVNEITQLKDLKAQNDALAEDIHNNIASLFSTAILQNQVQARTTMQGLTESLKDFKLSGDWDKLITDVGKLASADLPSWLKTSPYALPQVAANPIFGNDFGANFNPSHAAEGPAAPTPQPQQNTIDPTAVANQYKTLVGVLGSGATITDQFDSKLAALVVTARAAGVPADQLSGITDRLSDKLTASGGAAGVLGRALSALDLDKQASLASSYVSALGEFATAQDKATQAGLNFQKQQLQNPKLTNDQRTAVVALTQANEEWTRATNQSQVGVFDLAAAQKAADDQFRAQQAPGGYLDHATPEQLATAYQAYTNKVVALGEAAKVAGSAFPQLTQLGLDASNVNKQLDTFGTTTLNGVSDGLVSVANNSTSAGAAVTNFSLLFVTALEKMIIQMTIIKPLATALGSLLPGFGSIGGGSALPLPGQGSFIGPVASAKGNVFEGSNIIPFARGGSFTNSIVNSPTLFEFANGGALGKMGEAGPEAIVPLKRASDGSLGVASSGASSGGGGSNNVVVNVTAPAGAQVDHKQSSSGGVDYHDIIISTTNDAAASGKLDHSFGGRFGAKPKTVRR